MHPYNDHNPKIEFEERLGEYDMSDSSGSEGYVFKVRINSQPFALKMVNLCSLSYHFTSLTRSPVQIF